MPIWEIAEATAAFAASMSESGDELPASREAIFMALAERAVWAAANEFEIWTE